MTEKTPDKIPNLEWAAIRYVIDRLEQEIADLHRKLEEGYAGYSNTHDDVNHRRHVINAMRRWLRD